MEKNVPKMNGPKHLLLQAQLDYSTVYDVWCKDMLAMRAKWQ